MKHFTRAALFLFALILLLPRTVISQTVNFTATNIRVGGSLLASGQLCATPVDANNHPYQAGALGLGGGPLTSEPACATVTTGAIPTLPLPDTALTTPENICLRITVTDSSGAQRYMNPCVQPASSGQAWCTTSGGVTTCNFNNYASTAAPLPIGNLNVTDSTARTVASIAQTTAAAASTTATAALPANGCTSASGGNINCPGLLTGSGGVDIKTNSLYEELPNNPSSGATLFGIVITNSSGQAQTATTTSTMWTGIAEAGAVGSSSGNTMIARSGQASCKFDGAASVGDYVQMSATTGGECHDAGSTYPLGGAVLGRVTTAASGAGSLGTVNLYSPGIIAGGNGALQANGLSSSSGGNLSAPGTVTAGVVSTPKVVQADGFVGDNAFLQQGQFADGTQYSPSISFPTYPGSGIYHGWDCGPPYACSDWLEVAIDAVNSLQIRTSAVSLGTSQLLRWSSDTCIVRDGTAGVIKFGCGSSTAHMLRLYYDSSHYWQAQPDSSGKLLTLNIHDTGQCTMSAGTCSAQTLGHTYTAAPGCIATWTGTGTLTGHVKVTSTTTAVTASSDVNTDTAQVTWACFGN